ncbi:11248_t:CDS:2 [Dentiscutata heterogama]|uniref:11248_t:CDS:1 n=1 Tax=Dentiscutata heterogama TaxID=1316150 RepID=A0ACA9L309_9GLOM|nr:11248_t:CDS:2 [Dentiscutata heterogama]
MKPTKAKETYDCGQKEIEVERDKRKRIKTKKNKVEILVNTRAPIWKRHDVERDDCKVPDRSQDSAVRRKEKSNSDSEVKHGYDAGAAKNEVGSRIFDPGGILLESY